MDLPQSIGKSSSIKHRQDIPGLTLEDVVVAVIDDLGGPDVAELVELLSIKLAPSFLQGDCECTKKLHSYFSVHCPLYIYIYIYNPYHTVYKCICAAAPNKYIYYTYWYMLYVLPCISLKKFHLYFI